MVFAALPALNASLQAGKLKPLGVTSMKRSAALPNVPTLQEVGVDYDISIQYGCMRRRARRKRSSIACRKPRKRSSRSPTSRSNC